MKSWIFIALAVVGLTSVLSLREWLIYQEVKSQQSEMKHQISKVIETASSVERLQEIQKSPFLIERYLNPVINRSQRLLLPLLRQKVLNSWKQNIYQDITDGAYLRLVELREDAKNKISTLQASQEPSSDRLKQISRLSQRLDSELERVELIENEIDEIQNNLRAEDKKLMKELKEIGKESLSSFRQTLKQLDQEAVVDYLLSPQYQTEVLQPVLDKMFEINRPSLRKATWNEFSGQLRRLKMRKGKELMATREQDSPQNSELADLLYEHYQRSRDRQEAIRRHSTQTPGESPASSNFQQRLDTN